jgi:hypothetical protein
LVEFIGLNKKSAGKLGFPALGFVKSNGGSDHSEQDRSDESERSEDRQYVNPAGEKHLQSPLWLRQSRGCQPAGRGGSGKISLKLKAAA